MRLLLLALILSTLFSLASSNHGVFIDAGARDEDTSIITGEETWNHVGIRVNILETDTPSYYRTHRSGPDFTYTIKGFESKSLYNVSLGFAEIWGPSCASGARIMNVIINDVIVKSDLDVFQEAGCFTAHVESFIVNTDTEGTIVIRLVAVKENAMLSSISIVEDKSSTGLHSSSDDSSSDSYAVDWIEKDEDENYVARHECGFVQAGTEFFMFGGRENATRLDMYDFTANSWSQGASLPKELNHFQAVEYEGLIWVIGAFHSNNYPAERPAEYVYVYDPTNDVWMQGPRIPPQRRRGGGGVQVYNGKFYLMGGNTVGHSGWCVNWLDELDPQKGTWKTLPDAPRPRDHFHLATVGTRMYAAGGRRTTRYSVFSDTIAEVDVYDFESATWLTSQRPDDMPSPRAGAAAAVLDGKILIMGGESGEQSDAYDMVNELNPQTGKWTTVAPMNHPRHGTQAIVSGRSVFVAGGSPFRGDGNQRNMEAYNDDAPVGVPSSVGALSAQATIEVPVGVRTKVTIEHTSGSQGVFVQSVYLSGVSSARFSLLMEGTAPLLIRKGSSLEIIVEYTGDADNAVASLDLLHSGNEVLSIGLIGKLSSMGLRASQSPSRMPSTQPSDKPSIEPSASPSSRPSLPSPETTKEPPEAFRDFLIIDAGSNNEDDSLYEGRTWKYRAFSNTEIKGTSTPQYFRSHRSGETFLTYHLAGFVPEETYNVRLGFSEIWNDNCAVGQRVMAIEINGQVVEPRLDVYEEAGSCFTALVKSYTVAASETGTINVVFTASVEKPMVSVIQVRSNQDMVPSPKPSELSSSSPSIEEGDLPSERPSPSPIKRPSLRSTTKPTPSPISTSPATISMIVDAGSKNEDKKNIIGSTWIYGIPNSFNISKTNMPSVYRTHRSGPKFSYIFDGLLPGQNVGIELGFAETWPDNCAVARRVMSIAINGGVVNPALDVYKEVGCDAAHVEKYTATAGPDGKIEVALEASVENAMISFLRISEPSSTIASVAMDTGTQGEDMSLLSGDTWTYGLPLDVDVDETKLPAWGRTHRSGTTFTYTLIDLEAGAAYDLSLGFAEIWKKNCKIGKRIMKITVNGVVMKDDLDVFRLAGCNTAHVEIFATQADASGMLEIEFDASVQNAMVSYIEVAKSPTAVVYPTGKPTMAPTPFPTPEPTAKVSSQLSRENVVIDAGASNEDTSLISSDVPSWTYSIPNDVSIAGTGTRRPALFRTHRSSTSFTYTIDGFLSGNAYDIDLGFAETYSKACKVGKRIMEIRINGILVRSNLDVFDEVGCNTALIETFSAIPARPDGTIEISISASVENAMISLIEITPIETPAPLVMPSLMPSSQPSSSPTREGYVFIDAGSPNEDSSRFSQGTWEFSVSSDTEIKGTLTPQHFQTHRSSPSFTYLIDGFDTGEMYSVTLGFAETWSKNCNIGKRIMRIGINKKVVNPQLDVYKEVGCFKAYVDNFTTKATTSGEIIIDFDTIVENAMVSTISIEKIQI